MWVGVLLKLNTGTQLDFSFPPFQSGTTAHGIELLIFRVDTWFPFRSGDTVLDIHRCAFYMILNSINLIMPPELHIVSGSVPKMQHGHRHAF